MDLYACLSVRNARRLVPTIYLDSNIIIEFSRYKKGIYKGTYAKEISELFEILSVMIREYQILCPLGNQLSEIGMTLKREEAKKFLYQFINDEFLIPESVFNNQLQKGFKAFLKQKEIIDLPMEIVHNDNMSQFRINVSPIYTLEKAEFFKKEKEYLANILNEIKSGNECRKTFVEQLKSELETEFKLLVINDFQNPLSSEEAYERYFCEMEKFYRITGIVPSCNQKDFVQARIQYVLFLKSYYHHFLPYIWIRSNLWAYLMNRQNKIKKSDCLDIKWASAYLPYVDYAITDDDFCKTLQKTGMTEQYDVKVYSMRTMKELIEELKLLKQ